MAQINSLQPRDPTRVETIKHRGHIRLDKASGNSRGATASNQVPIAARAVQCGPRLLDFVWEMEQINPLEPQYSTTEGLQTNKGHSRLDNAPMRSLRAALLVNPP